ASDGSRFSGNASVFEMKLPSSSGAVRQPYLAVDDLTSSSRIHVPLDEWVRLEVDLEVLTGNQRHDQNPGRCGPPPTNRSSDLSNRCAFPRPCHQATDQPQFRSPGDPQPAAGGHERN